MDQIKKPRLTMAGEHFARTGAALVHDIRDEFFAYAGDGSQQTIDAPAMILGGSMKFNDFIMDDPLRVQSMAYWRE